MGKVLSASSILICAYTSVDDKNYNNYQILIVGLCDGLFIIMIYISPLMSSVCSSLFGCFCSLGCCGVHVSVNTSFLYRIGQVNKFAGFLCLCITFRLWLLVQYLIFILWFSC